MPAVKANALAEVPPGTVAEFEHDDNTYAICNVAGAIHCVDGICPHADGPLAQGALHGAILVCPWHGWEFDVRTGVCEADASCQLKTYQTVVENGHIYLQLPS
jgi:nitrite reductase (NADH) small subunit